MEQNRAKERPIAHPPLRCPSSCVQFAICTPLASASSLSEISLEIKLWWRSLLRLMYCVLKMMDLTCSRYSPTVVSGHWASRKELKKFQVRVELGRRPLKSQTICERSPRQLSCGGDVCAYVMKEFRLGEHTAIWQLRPQSSLRYDKKI